MWKKRRPAIDIKTPEQIESMRAAGLVVGNTLQLLKDSVKAGITTAELDELAEDAIRSAGAIPSFKGYHGFPASICTSVNDEIVHGIPNPHKVLRDGDVISIDCGAIVDGWHGDAALTVPVGEITTELHTLLEVCETALWHGLRAGRPGARLSDIGHAIEKYIRARGDYGIVEEYVGHGIGSEMHMDPAVPNYGSPGHGPVLAPGMCFAVEPMVNLGDRFTRTLADEWTVVTVDGRHSAHFEHTFVVTENGPRVLTALDEGTERFGGLD